MIFLARPEELKKARTFSYLPKKPDPPNPDNQLPAEPKDDATAFRKRFNKLCYFIPNKI